MRSSELPPNVILVLITRRKIRFKWFCSLLHDMALYTTNPLSLRTCQAHTNRMTLVIVHDVIG